MCIDGPDLVDGGVVSDVPVDHALEMGARSVVVLDCGVFGLRHQAPSTLLESIAPIMLRQQVVRDVPAVAREVPVLYLPVSADHVAAGVPRVGNAHGGGYEKARAFLATVEVAGPGLYGELPLAIAADDRLT